MFTIPKKSNILSNKQRQNAATWLVVAQQRGRRCLFTPTLTLVFIINLAKRKLGGSW